MIIFHDTFENEGHPEVRLSYIPFLVVLEDVDSFEAWDKSSKLVKENKLAGKLLLTGLFLSVAGVLLIMIVFPSNISNYKHYLEVLYKYWGVYYLVYNLFIYKFYKKIK